MAFDDPLGTTTASGNVMTTGAGESARTGTRLSPAVAAGLNNLPGAESYDEKVRDWVLQKYGPGMLALYKDPEIGPLLIESYKGGWEEAELMARVKGTNWWRTRSAAQRDFDLALNSDPGQVQRAVQQKQAAMVRRAKTLGITVSESELSQLAKDATRNKLSDDEVDDLLFSYFDTNKMAASKGTLGGSMARVKRIYGQYGMPISDATAAELGKQLITGDLSDDGLLSMLIEQTKARYPQMASLLDQGVTPKAYFAPIKETVAQTLEINPESIDIFDPKYSSVLNMPLYEVQKWARSQDEWKFTDQANKQANQVVDYIARTFGKVA